MSRRSFLVILAAFTLSVAVRWPLVDRPLSAHHEYCTAFTLIALTNWYEDGFATHHGMPSGGFISDGEKLYPAATYDRNQRAVGLYYFSHPPLAYDLPYLFFASTGSAPNAAGLQWFNIAFHLITALALYQAVRQAAGGTEAPLFAAVLYLFLPATLWFHGNAYMSDMFVQVPWVVHLLYAMRVLREPARRDPATWLGFAVSLFFVVYTSWLGVMAALSAVLVACWRWKNDRTVPVFRVVLVVAGACLLALGLTAFRFLQVIDAPALIDHLRSRLAVRGSLGITDATGLLHQFVVNYRIGFLPVLALLAVVGISLWKHKQRMPAHPDMRLFILLAGLPVLLDHALLLQYAAHDFAMLKAAPLFCGLAGFLLTAWRPAWGRAAIAFTCLASVLYFYRTNPLPGHDHGRYEQERTIGMFIAANAAPDEVVFAQGISTEPQVAWYARRNLLGVADVDAARKLLHERGLDKGVLIRSTHGELSATHFTR